MSNSAVWPAALDAVIASPEHHRVAFEDDTMRILETRILPGEITKLHTHELSGPSYVLEWTDCIRRDEHGSVMFDSKSEGFNPPAGACSWSGPLGPHTLENTGSGVVQVIRIEMKSTKAATTSTQS